MCRDHNLREHSVLHKFVASNGPSKVDDVIYIRVNLVYFKVSQFATRCHVTILQEMTETKGTTLFALYKIRQFAATKTSSRIEGLSASQLDSNYKQVLCF